MSFRPDQANPFIDPLRCKTTTLVSDEREASLILAKVVMASSSTGGDSSFILDFDALYSSNADFIFGSVPTQRANSTSIHIPDPESNVEDELKLAFLSDATVLIVDSLNTFRNMLSPENGASRSRKLSFSIASLSHFAESSKKAVILTMYRRERLGRPTEGRSMSSFSDATASVEVRGDTLSLKRERGVLWPGGELSIRIL